MKSCIEIPWNVNQINNISLFKNESEGRFLWIAEWCCSYNPGFINYGIILNVEYILDLLVKEAPDDTSDFISTCVFSKTSW